MPTLSGIDFLKSLKNPPKTIITTAYRDFAMEGFELEVIDYLLKPITFERFFKSIDRLLRINYNSIEPTGSAFNDEHIIIKSGVKNYRVNMAHIFYIESLRDYVKVHTMDGKEITFKNRISDMEIKLPKDRFLRVHRSYIINTNKISAFSSSVIEINGIEIPLGASYKKTVDTFLKGFGE
jgi:DNA-binding LytR/AlgR family response regulator